MYLMKVMDIGNGNVNLAMLIHGTRMRRKLAIKWRWWHAKIYVRIQLLRTNVQQLIMANMIGKANAISISMKANQKLLDTVYPHLERTVEITNCGVANQLITDFRALSMCSAWNVFGKYDNKVI